LTKIFPYIIDNHTYCSLTRRHIGKILLNFVCKRRPFAANNKPVEEFMKKVMPLVALMCLIAVGAQAGEKNVVSRHNFRDLGAQGFWGSMELGEPCTTRYVEVVASDGLHRVGGMKPEMESGIFIHVFRYNHCNEDYQTILTGEGELTPDQLMVKQTLKEAQLQGVVLVLDQYSQPVWVSIDLKWESETPLYVGRSNSFSGGPGFRFRSHFNGKFRYGQVTGAIIINGENLTPHPGGGGMHLVRSGFVEAIKNK
jgi:hypothetical protein